jgi:cell division protein FtsL
VRRYKEYEMQTMQAKKKMLITIVAIGLICITIVVLTAYAAELKCTNNELLTQGETLQGEIDTLSVKLKSTNSVGYIETMATEKLGMVYPDETQCVYLSEDEVPKGDLAMIIKENAYN